jgi:hypothetical protein
MKGIVRKPRKTLTLCAAAAVCVCLFPACLIFPEDDSKTKGPVPIRTVEDLNAVRYGLDKDYILEKPLIIISNWTPIGTGALPFTGVFDGNSHAITFGPYAGIDPVPVTEGELSAGIFGVLGSTGTVKNLTVKGLNVTINTDRNPGYNLTAGSIAGINTGTIINCAFEGGTIRASSNNVNSGAVMIYAGGICGTNGGTVSGCYVFNGKLYAENLNAGAYSWALAGGIAGLNENNGPIPTVIENCYSASGSSPLQQSFIQSSAAGSNYSLSGGIAGASSGAAINKCWSSVKLNALGTEGRAGGIAGYTLGGSYEITAYIQNCVALNDEISGKYAGRIIGYMETDQHTTFTDIYGREEMILSSGSDQTMGRNGPTVSDEIRKNYSWWITTAGWTLVLQDSINDASPLNPWVWYTASLLPYLYWESIW